MSHTEESNHRLSRIESELRDIQRNQHRIEHILGDIVAFLRSNTSPPGSPLLAGTFTLSGASLMTQAVLVATIPTSRTDGTVLAATAIASITFQKTSLTGTPPVAGPQVVLQTNSAVAGAGLLPTDITFTDPSSVAGDSYTAFVTDTSGNVSALSNAVVNAATSSLAAPAAPSLAATFA